MDPQRAYILVRIWEDFLPTTDLTVVSDLDDAQAQQQLDALGAEWLRLLARAEEDALSKWAASIPPADIAIRSRVDDNLLLRVGCDYLGAATLSHRLPRAPAWTLLHAEMSVERALTLVDALREEVPIRHPVHFLILREDELAGPVRLRYELELAEWDRRHLDIREIRVPKGLSMNPLKRLRQMALKLSSVLDNVKLRPHQETPTRSSDDGAPPTQARQPTARDTRAWKAFEWIASDDAEFLGPNGEITKKLWLALKAADQRGSLPEDAKPLPPSMETFTSYIRAYRRAMGMSTRQPRSGRQHGGSIVEQKDI